MKWFSRLLIAALVLAGYSCSRDPEVAKRKYVENGNLYFERGKYKEASIMYRSALQKDMRYGEAYYRLGLTQLKLNQVPAAARSLVRAVELLTDNGPEQAAREDARTKLADLYLGSFMADPVRNKGLKPEINDLAEQLLKRDPKSFHGLRLQGYLAWMEGNRKEAVARFRAAHDVKPFDPDVVLALSQVLIADGQFQEGEKLALALVDKKQAFAPIYDMLYVQYVRSRRIDDAEKILSLKARNNPKEIEYQLQLARHYFGRQRRDESEKIMQNLLSNSSDFPDGRLKVGDFYREIHDLDKALETFRAGLASATGPKAQLRQRVAEILAAQGKRAEASQAVEEILKDNPKDAAASALRATLILESGDAGQLQSAVSELEASLNRMPENPVIRFNLGRAYMAKGEFERARTQFQEAIRMRADYLPPRLWLGQAYLYAGEFAKALQTANEALTLSPHHAQARLLRAMAMRSSGNYDQARRELAALAAANPSSIDIHFQLGILDLTQRNFKDAERSFRNCVNISSEDLRCLMGLVETYTDQKQFDPALRVLTEARQKMPGQTQVQLALANTAVLAGKFDMGIGIYSELLTKDANSSELHLKLGEAYRRKGDVDPALKHFAKAKDLNPSDARSYLPLGILLDTTGRRTEARSVYEQALKLQPDNGVVLNNLAYLIAETGGDLDQALTYAQRAKQKLPQDHNVSDTLGWIYVKKNLSSNAIQIYRELVAAVPDNPTYRYHFAMALFQIGDKAGARKEIEAALRAGPAKEEAAKMKELLAKIG